MVLPPTRRSKRRTDRLKRRRKIPRRKTKNQASEGLCLPHDEFADAEVDEAEETPSLLASKASAETDQQQQQQQQQVNAVNGRSEEGKAAAGEEAHANKGEGAEQTNDSEDDQEEGAGMTLDDVSDLDDREPPTSDGIFAFYEKVERAAAGAARRTSKWKVLLRYGILRVGSGCADGAQQGSFLIALLDETNA
ncbi:hypothetical protein Efla_005410 [Eimeria flavescens]